jgi:drug/metabolite transporter (DMT)-like permease
LETWVWITIGAAFFQNMRSALQKGLTARHGVIGATFARFVYAAPLAALAVAALAASGRALPGVTAPFLAATATGGLAQIAATLLLVRLFSLRNFAVGNTFARTETVQAALLGALLFGERIGPGPLAAIMVSLVGIVVLSGTTGFGRGIVNRAALYGLGAGLGFAASGVAFRAATLSLEGDADPLTRAAFALAVVTLIQTAVMAAWMLRHRADSLAAVLVDWRRAGPVGLVGTLGSLGWYTAFALQPAALVKAVGQVELIFSYLTARLIFGERPSPREILGILLVALGIVFLVLTASLVARLAHRRRADLRC